ncbi:MAG TPA: PilZ domain-containing protein, partial [Spongiibacteraceae bacterium]|nr:PilZ domain-containing protein [Spongiibacteraceae bacterium]
MEHRYGQRMPAYVKVIIHQQGLPVAVGRLRNIGRHGFLVESEYMDVAVNQPLELELLLSDTAADEHILCRVMVMHKAARGFGVAIDETCPASYTVLALLAERFRYQRIPPINPVPVGT